MDTLDSLTVDSWNETATQVTTATVPLVLADDSSNTYICPKHPDGPHYNSAQHYCELCEAEFQQKRQQLQERQSAVNQQLQSMDATAMSQLQASLQQFKPQAEKQLPPRPPSNGGGMNSSPSNSGINMNMHHHHHISNDHQQQQQHHHQNNNMNMNNNAGGHTMNTGGGGGNNTMSPTAAAMNASSGMGGGMNMNSNAGGGMHNAGNGGGMHGMPPMPGMPGGGGGGAMGMMGMGGGMGGGGGNAPYMQMDALTMQLQRMQHMQDWMLLQKEQECLQLKEQLELSRQQIQELRVENALLTEKLSQQEERMQHELKLIKLAALQQQRSGSNSNKKPPMLMLPQSAPAPAAAAPFSEETQEFAGDWPAFPSEKIDEKNTEDNAPPMGVSKNLEMKKPEMYSRRASDATTATNNTSKIGEDIDANVQEPIMSPVQAAVARMEKISVKDTPPVTENNKVASSANTTESQDKTEEHENRRTPPSITSSQDGKPAAKREEPEQAPKEAPKVEAPPEMGDELVNEEDDGADSMEDQLGDVPSRLFIDEQAESLVPLDEKITGATQFVAPHILQGRGHAASHVAYNTMNVKPLQQQPQQPQPPPINPPVQQQQQQQHTRNTSNISDFGMDDLVDTWSYKADEPEPSNNIKNLSTIDNPSPNRSQEQTPPVRASGVSFPDDNASQGETVTSSTFGEDRQTVANKSILDPYGDRGHFTGVILRSTGMPHGSGKMVYQEDKRTYDGEWRHGRWHGFGRATFANGDHYVGEYRFDQRHGRGRYEWNDGRVYDGAFREDKRHGHGRFEWPDGAVYEGEFRNGQREGKGIYTFSDGGCYEGSWRDGRYSGFGICSWEDGRTYKGEWLNGMAHGKGIETFADGNVRHEGLWLEDEPVLNGS